MMKNKFMNTVSILAVVLILILNITTPAFAAESDSKVVRVACGMNDILYLNKDGDPEGIGLSYLRQLAWNNNWTLEYVEGSYNECLEKLYNGEIDFMFPVGKEEDPDGKLAFSQFSIGYQQIGLFAKEDADIYYDDFTAFDHAKVALSLGGNSTILDKFASENNFVYEQVPMDSKQDKIDALINGDVDLIAISTLNTIPEGKLVAVLDQLPFYICTRADNTELLGEINKSMSEILTHTPEFASTLFQSVLAGRNPISYTREEQERIAQEDTIIFGVYSDRLPLAGMDENGNCVGIYVDLLKEISQESGLKIEIKPITDSNKLYSYIDDGTVDFVLGIQELRFSQDNAENHLSSDNLTDCTTIAITQPDYNLDEATAPVVALTQDRTYLESTITEWFPSATIQYYDTRRQCLDAVKNNTADVAFLNTWECNYEIKNARYKGLMEWESYRSVSGLTIGASRQSDLELLSILEKTIGKIPADRITDIVTSNLNSSYETYTLADRFYAVRTPLIISSTFVAVLLIALFIYLRAKRNYIKNLEEANHAKSEFLSRMSHELRTPLNALSGYSELMRDNLKSNSIDPKYLLQNISLIERAKAYLLRVIDDVLDVQNAEFGKIRIQKEEIDGQSLIEATQKVIEAEAAEKGVDFSYIRLTNYNDTIITDGIRLQQIVLNLVHNAIKFTPAGGSVNLTVETVEQTEDTATLRIIISDTGIGMSQEFMSKKLFTIFAQENAGTTSPYEGCGTGLAICKQLIDLMGGTITCISEKGNGSTFTVMLPVGRVQKPARKARVRREHPTYDLSGTRILLAEDNPMNQDIEKRLLEKMHCQVELADDGQIALDKYKNSTPGYYNVILMDIRMPNMDGWECTRQIRACGKADAASIPILAVSANAFEEDIQHSLAAGMNEHLSKPVDAKLLAEKISNYCSKATPKCED